MVVTDHKQVVSIQNNLSGDAIRVLLSNAGSPTAIDFERMTLTAANQQPLEITRQGDARIHLEACDECFSDEIFINIEAGEPITIATYTNGTFPVTDTVMHYGAAINTVTREGRLKYPLIGRKVYKQTYAQDDCMWMYGFREVQVRTNAQVKTIAVFGDSITHMSFWTAALAERLYKKYPKTATMKNCGISGNRLLRDSSRILFIKGMFGEAGIRRFERDVFGNDAADAVLVMEGINDLCHPVEMKKMQEMPSAEALTDGLKRLVNMAHAHHAKIFLCTILPFGGYKFWCKEIEDKRCQVNDWIRKSDYADGFFDLDATISAAGKGLKLDDDYHTGDHLHPNAEGGRRIAESIDIDILMAN